MLYIILNLRRKNVASHFKNYIFLFLFHWFLRILSSSFSPEVIGADFRGKKIVSPSLIRGISGHVDRKSSESAFLGRFCSWKRNDGEVDLKITHKVVSEQIVFEKFRDGWIVLGYHRTYGLDEHIQNWVLGENKNMPCFVLNSRLKLKSLQTLTSNFEHNFGCIPIIRNSWVIDINLMVPRVNFVYFVISIFRTKSLVPWPYKEIASNMQIERIIRSVCWIG